MEGAQQCFSLATVVPEAVEVVVVVEEPEIW